MKTKRKSSVGAAKKKTELAKTLMDISCYLDGVESGMARALEILDNWNIKNPQRAYDSQYIPVEELRESLRIFKRYELWIFQYIDALQNEKP
jgi:hypothetical protein